MTRNPSDIAATASAGASMRPDDVGSNARSAVRIVVPRGSRRRGGFRSDDGNADGPSDGDEDHPGGRRLSLSARCRHRVKVEVCSKYHM